MILFNISGASKQTTSKSDPQFSFAKPNKSKKISSKSISYNVSSKQQNNKICLEENKNKKISHHRTKPIMNKNLDTIENKDNENTQIKENITFLNQSEKIANPLIVSCRKNCRSRRKTLAEGCSRKDKSESSTQKSGR